MVEDNPTNRAVAEAILTAAGLDVSLASNGADALAALRSAHFDVVLMDIHMPVMDGVEAVKRIPPR